jgi:hypothetical protein
MKELETANYEHRQEVLRDMELFRQKEADLATKRTVENESLRIKNERATEQEKRHKHELLELEKKRKTINENYERDLDM